jgi:hypothetical protein
VTSWRELTWAPARLSGKKFMTILMLRN